MKLKKASTILEEEGYMRGIRGLTAGGQVHTSGMPDVPYSMFRPHCGNPQAMHTIILTTTAVIRMKLSLPAARNDWGVVKAIPYANRSELTKGVASLMYI